MDLRSKIISIINLKDESQKLGLDELMEKYVMMQIDYNQKYPLINFKTLVQDNCEDEQAVIILMRCFKALSKYLHNLKLEEKPRNWQRISFKNPFFSSHVKPIQGHLEILKIMGYRQADKNYLIHVGNTHNSLKLPLLETDLKCIILEITYWLEGSHSFPEMINILLKKKTLKDFKKSKSFTNQTELNEKFSDLKLKEKTRTLSEDFDKKENDKPSSSNSFHNLINFSSDDFSSEGLVYNEQFSFSLSNSSDSDENTWKWKCHHCTYINQHNSTTCRKKSQASSQSNFNHISPHTCIKCSKTSEIFCQTLEQRKKIENKKKKTSTALSKKEINYNKNTYGSRESMVFVEKKRKRQMKRSEEVINEASTKIVELLEEIDRRIGIVPDYEAKLLCEKVMRTGDPLKVVDEWERLFQRVVETLKIGRDISDNIGPRMEKIIKFYLVYHSGNEMRAIDNFKKTWHGKIQEIKKEYSKYDFKDDELKQIICHQDCDFEKIQTFIEDLIIHRTPNLDSRKPASNEEFEIYSEKNINNLIEPDTIKFLLDTEKPIELRIEAMRKLYTKEEEIIIKKTINLMDWVTETLNKQEKEIKNGVGPKFLDQNKLEDLSECLEKIKENKGNLEKAIESILIDCDICCFRFPKEKFVTFIGCNCQFCEGCATYYFGDNINLDRINNMKCMKCSQPEINFNFENETYFQQLKLMLQKILPEKQIDKLDSMIIEWSLRTEEKIYCPWCSYWFIKSPSHHITRIQCHGCGKFFCSNCAEKLEKKTVHLCPKKDDRECPRCKITVQLDRGGCLHFVCPKCKFKFCGFCEEEFVQDKNKGLHCYHLRNCLFFLRDWDKDKLLDLIKMNNVAVDQTALEKSSLVSNNTNQNESYCFVLQTKNEKHVETPCREKPEPGGLGLCLSHFKEFLSELIKKNKIYPEEIMEKNELINCLKREKKKKKYFEFRNNFLNKNLNNNFSNISVFPPNPSSITTPPLTSTIIIKDHKLNYDSPFLSCDQSCDQIIQILKNEYPIYE